jgi:predicted dehydrogenase
LKFKHLTKLYSDENDGLEFQGKVQAISGNYNAFYDNIFDVLKNSAELAVKPEEATEVLKILEACLESNRKRKAIAF